VIEADAIISGHVFLFEIAVAGAGLRRHEYISRDR
jgi:hypothetical protein